MSISLRRCSNEIKQEITEEVQEMLDIFESIEKKVKNQTQEDRNFQDEIDRLLETSLSREIRDCVILFVEKQKNEMLVLKKKKIACDVSWKSRMTKLSDENVLLKTQVESVVQERENIKIEFQEQFNSIKATWVQHQQEVNELIEHVNQKTYAYADVRAKNQDLLITISELKVKLAAQAKNVNTKFDKSTTLEKLVYVTPLNRNKDLKAITVSKVEIKTDKSKPVTSRVACSSSVSRSDSKDTNSKKRVLLNTKSKRTSKDVKKSLISFTSVANKYDTMNLNVSDSKKNVLKVKIVNAVHDGSNLVCVSCGKDVFMISHDKCVAYYALSPNSRVKRSLFTSHVAAKSSKLRATSIVVKSRFNVATPPKATNRVSSLGHNLFSVGKFCDGDLEVAFRSNTCFVRNLEGEDILTGSRESNLYNISVFEMAASSSVCLMSKAMSTKLWLWH
ncbi:hypothetical protein Tco_0053113 [Tanacetum coccineum]